MGCSMRPARRPVRPARARGRPAPIARRCAATCYPESSAERDTRQEV